MNLTQLSIKQAHEGLARKEFTASELVKAALQRIDSTDRQLNAFVTVTAEPALKRSQEIDEAIRKGEMISALAGLPMAIKDVLTTRGIKTTAGSKILESYQPSYTATAVQKLFEAGSVMIGKTNCDEFAMGASGEWSAYGPTRNPWDLERVPGGSSSGSAAAVAAGECFFTLGTDTGGSVRQPAGFCNLVGLKPTYGRVSRSGLIAMASSLDQVGVITRTVEDCAIVLRHIAGHDPMDSTSAPNLVPDYEEILNEAPRGLRLGVPKEYFIEGMDSGVEQVVRTAIKKLAGLGFEIVDVSLPHTPDALSVYYLIMPAEASSNLARFDGIRYGLSLSEDADSLIKIYQKTRAAGFGPEPKRRIILGTFVLSAGYQEKYYQKAQRVRSIIIREYQEVFKKVDCLVVPTSPTVPFLLGERKDDPLQMYLADIFTVSANITGLPALSLPAGFVKGLPVGIQLMTSAFREDLLFQVGQAYQQATDWHLQAPEFSKVIVRLKAL